MNRTAKRTKIIVGAFIAAIIIAVVIWAAIARISASTQPGSSAEPPPLATPDVTSSPMAPPSTSPSTSPTPSEEEVPDPSTIPGAIESNGIWAVPCDSEWATADEVADGLCLVQGTVLADSDQAVSVATAFIEQWMILDTDEGWGARDERLAPYVADTFDAPFPELAWESRYQQAGSLPYRAQITSAEIGSTAPQLAGVDTYEMPFVVTWAVEWHLPDGEVSSLTGYDVWSVTVTNGQVVAVDEPNVIQ